MGIGEAVRHHDKATVRLACLCGNDGFQLGHVANRCCDRRHCEGSSGGFEGFQPEFGICRRRRVKQDRDPDNTRCNLLEQFQPLAPERVVAYGETGDVAARSREARDKALPTGSATVAKTIGMVRVCRSSAAVVGVVLERRTSGCSATSSIAKRRIDSASSGVAQRVSTWMLRPPVHPSFWNASRNAAYQARAV